MSGLIDRSPWWWVALATLLAAIEMLTISTVLIWSSIAALLTAFCLWMFPGLSLAGQIVVFALLSIALAFAGRSVFNRFGVGRASADKSKLNRRTRHLAGREAVVVSFTFHEGQVTVDDMPWPARLEGNAPTPNPGDRVQVVATDGIVVWVRPIAAPAAGVSTDH